jgi:DNA-binding transcriptional LysR family regulator
VGIRVTRKTDFVPAQRAGDDLLSLRAVARVADTRSFSAAARAMGVQVSTVTRAVARLEGRLGTTLFLRSTHGLAPTEAGRAYVAHVARWLAEEDALRDRIATMRDTGGGTLRVTVPVFVAQQVLPAVVLRFHRDHPDAVLDVHASDDTRDVVREAFDLAIRLGPLPDSTLRGRRLVSFRRISCASPRFLERHGTPRNPRALAALPCVLYGSGAAAIQWAFRRTTGARVRVEVRGPFRSNNLDLLVTLAEAGLGVARLPDWAARAALSSGRLVEVLPTWAHERERDRPALYALHAADPGKDRLRRAFLATLDDVVRAGFGPARVRRDRNEKGEG